MQANIKFHFKYNSINIYKKKPEIHLPCYRGDKKMCIPTDYFKAEIQNIKYLNTKMLVYHAFIEEKS